MNRFAALALLLSTLTPTFAHADRAAVADVLDTHIQSYFDGDYEAIARLLPSGILQGLADRANSDVDTVVAAFAERIAPTEGSPHVVGNRYDRNSINIQTAPDGTEYAIVMVTSYWRQDADNLFTVTNANIIFDDGDQWVISRLQKPEDLDFLTSAYPQFADVSYPQTITMRVENNEVPEGAFQ